MSPTLIWVVPGDAIYAQLSADMITQGVLPREIDQTIRELDDGTPDGALRSRLCFTKKSAETFFTRLQEAGVTRLIDVRLNNVSQLAGFAKRDDLAYFLRAVADIDYLPLTDLAPTREMLDPYKKKGGAWEDYEKQFLELMAERQIERTLSKDDLHDICLLCSEDKPHHCHRRLVAEYLSEHWGNVEVVHLT